MDTRDQPSVFRDAAVNAPSVASEVPDRSPNFHALSDVIAAFPTVTQALQHWRREHGFGVDPIRAVLLAPVMPLPVSVAQCNDLKLRDGEQVLERRVALEQAGARLVVATNWYVPSRLPSAIAAALNIGDVPFGRLIAPLGGYRIPLCSRISSDGASLDLRAIVRLGDGTRVAVVEERFLPAVLERADL